MWELQRGSQPSGTTNGETSNIESILSGDSSTQWLVLTKTGGLFEVRAQYIYCKIGQMFN